MPWHLPHALVARHHRTDDDRNYGDVDKCVPVNVVLKQLDLTCTPRVLITGLIKKIKDNDVPNFMYFVLAPRPLWHGPRSQVATMWRAMCQPRFRAA